MKKIFLILGVVFGMLMASCSSEEPNPIGNDNEQQGKFEDETIDESNPQIFRPLTQAEFDKYIDGRYWTSISDKYKEPEWVHEDGSITEAIRWLGWDSYMTNDFVCRGDKWTRFFPEWFNPNEPRHPSFPYLQFTYDFKYNPLTGEMIMRNPLTDETTVWYEIEWLNGEELAVKCMSGLYKVDEGYTRKYFYLSTQERIDEVESWDDLGRYY